MVAMFASGDPSAAAAVVAEDYIDHQGFGSGPINGIDGFTLVVRTNHAAYRWAARSSACGGSPGRAIWCARTATSAVDLARFAEHGSTAYRLSPETMAKVNMRPSSASSMLIDGFAPSSPCATTARVQRSQSAHPSRWRRARTLVTSPPSLHCCSHQAALCQASASHPTTASMCSGIASRSLTSVRIAGVAIPICPPGAKNAKQTGEQVVVSAEILPRVDADDRIEEVVLERQPACVGADCVDLVADTGLVEQRIEPRPVDPQVDSPHLHVELPRQEHRCRALAAAEVENAHPHAKAYVGEKILQEPEWVRAHVEPEEPVRVVRRRTRVGGMTEVGLHGAILDRRPTSVERYGAAD